MGAEGFAMRARRELLATGETEWHLSKVFAKLGITSRRHLQHALPVS
jgi:DNA-binding CsgD family transcriptional regulator